MKRIASILMLAGTLAGCVATWSPGASEYRSGYAVDGGTYPYCPPPCAYQSSYLYAEDFANTRFFYPVTPYYYGPTDPFWGGPWLVHSRPPQKPVVTPTPPPAPQPPPATPPPAGGGSAPIPPSPLKPMPRDPANRSKHREIQQ